VQRVRSSSVKALAQITHTERGLQPLSEPAVASYLIRHRLEAVCGNRALARASVPDTSPLKREVRWSRVWMFGLPLGRAGGSSLELCECRRASEPYADERPEQRARRKHFERAGLRPHSPADQV
jgi:hypothetical protein